MKRTIFLSIFIVSSLLSMEPDESKQPESPEFLLQSIQNNSSAPIIIKNSGQEDIQIEPDSNIERLEIKMQPLSNIKIFKSIQKWWQQQESQLYPNIDHSSNTSIAFTSPFIFYPTIQTSYDINRVKPSLLEIYFIRKAYGCEYREKKQFFYSHTAEKCLFSIIIKDELFKATGINVEFEGTAASLFKQCFHKVLQFERENKLTIANLPEDLNELISDAKKFAKEKKEL